MMSGSITKAVLGALLLGSSITAMAALAAPAAFRTADGAYTTVVGGDLTDPYFVNKSLIIALDAGLDVRPDALGWLDWLLPRQRPDGGFDRFCGARSGQWVACMEADADDSMAATTIHLINLMRQKGWLDASHDTQAGRAERAATGLLRTLRDPADGLYRAFADRPAQYLMDNLEVLDALRSADESRAADELGTAIRAHFLSATAGWRPSRPDMPVASFYPHALARTFVWRSGLMSQSEAAADEANWLALYSSTWLRRDTDPFAWGLVAWDIHQLAPIQAACWRASVRLDPEAVGWTVLDAYIDAALARKGIQADCPRALLPSPVSSVARTAK